MPSLQLLKDLNHYSGGYGSESEVNDNHVVPTPRTIDLVDYNSAPSPVERICRVSTPLLNCGESLAMDKSESVTPIDTTVKSKSSPIFAFISEIFNKPRQYFASKMRPRIKTGFRRLEWICVSTFSQRSGLFADVLPIDRNAVTFCMMTLLIVFREL